MLFDIFLYFDYNGLCKKVMRTSYLTKIISD